MARSYRGLGKRSYYQRVPYRAKARYFENKRQFIRRSRPAAMQLCRAPVDKVVYMNAECVCRPFECGNN